MNSLLVMSSNTGLVKTWLLEMSLGQGAPASVGVLLKTPVIL